MLSSNDVLQTMKTPSRLELITILTIYEEKLVKLRNKEWSDDQWST